MTADRTLIASALTYARAAGWQCTRRTVLGGWAVHEWFNPGRGVVVEIREDLRWQVRLCVGLTTGSAATEASGGMSGSLRQVMDVLVALGYLPSGMWSEQAKVAELVAQLDEFLPRKAAA